MTRTSYVRVLVTSVLVGIVVAISAVTACADTGSAGSGSATGSAGSSSGSAGSSDSGSGGSSSGSAGSAAALPIPSVAGVTALGWAWTQVGKPYLWGGTGPDAWDCSGLVQWAFRQAGVRLPRTTWQQATVGAPVPLAALAPGDIVVLNHDGSHVGIYAGFGQVFNAYDYGVPVGLSPLAGRRIYAIRRF